MHMKLLRYSCNLFVFIRTFTIVTLHISSNVIRIVTIIHRFRNIHFQVQPGQKQDHAGYCVLSLQQPHLLTQSSPEPQDLRLVHSRYVTHFISCDPDRHIDPSIPEHSLSGQIMRGIGARHARFGSS